jgi:hypothetical protein
MEAAKWFFGFGLLESGIWDLRFLTFARFEERNAMGQIVVRNVECGMMKGGGEWLVVGVHGPIGRLAFPGEEIPGRILLYFE